MHPTFRRYLDDPTTVFLLCLTTLLTCQVGAPVAWWMASRLRRHQLALGDVPDALTNIGRWLAIGGTVLLGLGLVWSAWSWLLFIGLMLLERAGLY